ncbi:hypothetical protein [Lacrimispora saccharolytica]|uniref:Uncharacterized protein n=1 Tax=Lacrimispora saccharolytica (strain ATCC 35040 / DSM 2544 / NRCC 2533 / WM1) TaxID=610130 RepID=D9R437_LACSW|nr:hypothetical protein [Lacrimispora saccharolytica]ADL03150.1 hypothetical protein Closa_0514 [[Clostridium] saccharolyticum WM1]QRV18673.1 hypothetical protein I6K70_14290 [Lacrimispora saccharolytica]
MTPYEDKTLKDTLHEEGQKLRNMSATDRLWYIWEYYRIPIIIVIVAAVLISSIGSAVYNNRFETALSCVILNSSPTGETDNVDAYFNQGFRQYIELKEDAKIDVDYSMSPTFDESSMNEFTYAQLAKITAMISSKGLDVMIGKPDTIDHFGEMGGFIDLKVLLPADLYESWKDSLYFVTNQETGEKIACGLLISSTDFSRKTGLVIDEPVLAVMSNSTHTDTALELIRYVFGQ